jgi:Holliday junction resolvase-like predicted endonuclease
VSVRRCHAACMLTEDEVVDAVCSFLESCGYRIVRRATTMERGDDIVAAKGDDRFTLHVEAKGETSNRRNSARFGKPFDAAQCRDHVANAFFAAAAQLSAPQSGARRVGIALPDTRRHNNCVAKIQRAVDLLEIAIFWVTADRRVRLASKWPL